MSLLLQTVAFAVQEKCHQKGVRPPSWVRWIDAPSEWAERVSEKTEGLVSVSIRPFVWLFCMCGEAGREERHNTGCRLKMRWIQSGASSMMHTPHSVKLALLCCCIVSTGCVSIGCGFFSCCCAGLLCGHVPATGGCGRSPPPPCA